MSAMSTLRIKTDRIHTLTIVENYADNGLILGSADDIRAILAILSPLVVEQIEVPVTGGLLSVSEAARQFNLSPDTVRRAARKGHIKLAQKNGRDWNFPADTFTDWLRNEHRPRRQAMAYTDELTDYGRNGPGE